MPDPTLRDPLRRPLFRRLATTYALNELGDWMGIVALSVLVFDRTGSAYATAALFLGTRFLPAVLSPPLVARVEQPPPRFALPVIYCGEAAAFGALALLADHFSLAAVVALAAVDGTLALTGRALTRAVVARALEPFGELRAGNAVLNVAFTVGAAVGPAIAGLVVAGFGVQTALLLDAASFYLIACILLSARSMPEVALEPGGFRERLRAGLAYIREKTTLKQLLVAQGGALVFFAAVLPIEVIYAKDVLGAGDSGYGLLLASWGTGMVLGSFIFASARRGPLPNLLFFSTLTVAVGYLGLAAAPTLAVACAASVIGGTGNGVQWVSAVSAVQELTPQEMQARVISVLESLAAAMPGFGFVLGGVVASLAEPRATFLVAGVGIIGIVLVASATLKARWAAVPSVRGAPHADAEDPIVLELIPTGRTFHAGAEVPDQSKPEVRP
jgi:MFS family permease